MMPAAPLGGATTTRPPAAFSSFTASGPKIHPVQDLQSVAWSALKVAKDAGKGGRAALDPEAAGQDAISSASAFDEFLHDLP